MIGQAIPGIDEAIRSAASTNRYEAVVLVVVMVTVIAFLVYLVRTVLEQANQREKRLGERIDALEAFIRTELMQALSENTKAMLTISVSSAENIKAVQALIETLHTTRICFLTGEQQTKIVDTIAERVARKIGG